MNNSTITQRPEWHFTLVALGKKNGKTQQQWCCGAAAGTSPLHADTSAF